MSTLNRILLGLALLTLIGVAALADGAVGGGAVYWVLRGQLRLPWRPLSR